jgi:dsDNA-binding SOS-regulon protein
MKILPYIVMVSLLVLNASCDKRHSEKNIKISKDIKQIIFFSNEKEINREAAYYDALLELKKDFPEEMHSMQVLPADEKEEYLNSYHDQTRPALLVIYKNQVMVNINGAVSKEQITQPVSRVLQTN